MKKKRGYLWVDWVELGCRSWEIDHTGAELVDGENFAHLDRTTLDIAFGGSRHHLARVINDLRAAGMMWFPSDRTPIFTWPHNVTAGTASAGTANALSWSVNVIGWGQELDNGMVWTHPSGATLSLTNPPKVEGRFRRWLRTAREAYLAVMMESFYRWFQSYKKLAKNLDRAA